MSVPVKLDSTRSWCVVVMLTFAYALAYVDRQLLNLLVDPIRSSLKLSDTEFSLLQGIAFVSAYLLAIPVFGRLADTRNRRNVLIFGVCCWSIFTALCGHATSFLELAAARFGVGVAEASVYPVAWSLIADYFSQKRAARAFSIFTLGSPLGSGFSLLASGLVIAFAASFRDLVPALAQLEVWQMAFVVVGAPGLLFAALLFTMQEPVRQRSALVEDAAERKSVGEVARMLWDRRSFYGRIYVGTGMLAIVQLGLGAWFPTFLIRVHHMAPAEVGFRYGALGVLGGVTGALVGPFFSRWLERRGRADAPFRTAFYASAVVALCCAAVPALGGAGALYAAAGAIFASTFPLGVLAGATQFATPSWARGIVASLYSFFSQMIGFGFAPTAVALLTDKVFRDPLMVGHSLQIVTTTAAIVAVVTYATIMKVYRQMLNAADRTVTPTILGEPQTGAAR